jgi:hypothetical protein
MNEENGESKELISWKADVRDIYVQYCGMQTITPHTIQWLWRHVTVLASTLYQFDPKSPLVLPILHCINFLSWIQEGDPNNSLHYQSAMIALYQCGQSNSQHTINNNE